MVKGLKEYIKKYNIKTVVCRGEKYLVFYKAVTANFGSCWEYVVGITRKIGPYKPGTLVMCRHYDNNRRYICSCGLHITNMRNVKIFRDHNYPSLLHCVQVLVKPKDIVCVPYAALVQRYSYGAIRCKKLFVTNVIS
jgi:hypothetical protein